MKREDGINRRAFLASAAATAAMGITIPVKAKEWVEMASRAKIPIGAQLWTLRKEIAKDLAGTIEKVAEIGYQGVELLWLDKPPAAARLRKIIKGNNLKITSAHVPLTELQDNFRAIADYHRELGNSTLVIPYLPGHKNMTEDDWKDTVREIAKVAQQCKESGFRLLYHNHDFEFRARVGKMDAHDYIFASVKSELLQAQLDTYFIWEVGKNPAEYIRRYAGRLPSVHLKEKPKPGAKFKNTELGRGVIDWDAVFVAAKDAGVEWYLVEQNCEELPALESIKISYEFLKSRGIAQPSK